MQRKQRYRLGLCVAWCRAQQEVHFMSATQKEGCQLDHAGRESVLTKRRREWEWVGCPGRDN
jgi:hypothetical protein